MFAARPPRDIPDDDASWDMQEHCQAMLAQAGYAQYEVSAYVRPGRHGKLTLGAEQDSLRRWKTKHPTRYLAAAGHAEALGGDDRIAPARRPFEYMLNALRLVDGFALDAFEARTGLPRATIAPALEQAQAQGWLSVDGDRVRPTELGRRFTNDVIELFLDEDAADGAKPAALPHEVAGYTVD